MSAARGDLYLLIVDVPVCNVTPVILHGVVSPEKKKKTWKESCLSTETLATIFPVYGEDPRTSMSPQDLVQQLQDGRHTLNSKLQIPNTQTSTIQSRSTRVRRG